MLFLGLSSVLMAQDSLILTLEEAISMAKKNSIEAQIAGNRFNNAFWSFRSFKADQRPVLNLNGTIPSFNRSISTITLPDGTDVFVNRSLANSSLNLALSQEIPFTGGRIYAGSNLNRIDLFADSNTVAYLSSPFFVGIQQPLFGYNSWKWRRQIEPLRLEEADRGYLEDMEDVAIQTVNLFFSVHLAQINRDIAEFNLANNDSIYKVSQGRYNLGKIAENDLLQIELTVLNAQVARTIADNDINNNSSRLRRFLGLQDNTPVRLIPPTQIPELQVEPAVALKYALELRSDPISFQRQQIEAEEQLAQVKGNTGFSANLFAEYGLQGSSGGELGASYSDPQSFQTVALSLSVPILDWGKAKSQREIARSNLDLIESQIRQSSQNFEQEVYLRVQQFNIQSNQVKIAAKADTVSRRRFKVAKNRYIIGNTDITDLNIASAEEDQARRAYISALLSYWNDYYAVRKLTLFDFVNSASIVGTHTDN
ncbi:MAG: outer membrane protein [Limisphaerales bacterium]|jgi:outer membrane protein